MRNRAIAMAAQCWCHPTTENKEMDVELAKVFAGVLETFMKENEDLKRLLAEKNETANVFMNQVKKLQKKIKFYDEDN